MANKFTTWVRSFFGGNLPDARQSAGGFLGGVLAGPTAPRRGTKELLQAYRRLPWLHTVVRRISQDVAGARWKMYRTTNRGAAARRMFRTVRRGGMGYAPENATPVDAHPFLDTLAKPNPVLSPMACWWVMQGLLELKGECPVILERAKAGAVVEFWPAPPHWLIETPTAARPTYRFSVGAWYREVPATDVLFLRHPDLENPYTRGTGTGEAAADELDIDEFAARHLKSFFYNRALPDAFVSVEGLTDLEEAKAWEDRIRAKHQGIGKGFQVHVAAGKVNVKELGASFRENQIVELRGAQRDMIVQLFNVPPEVLGIIENSNRATIDAADYLYQKNVICPRLDFLADAFTMLIDDPTLVVGYESPIPDDDEFTLKVMQAQPRLFSKNEWRELAGAEPLPEFDDQFPEAPGPTFGAPSGGSLPAGDDEVEDEPGETEDPGEDDDAAEDVRRSLRARHSGRLSS